MSKLQCLVTNEPKRLLTLVPGEGEGGGGGGAPLPLMRLSIKDMLAKRHFSVWHSWAYHLRHDWQSHHVKSEKLFGRKPPA